MAIWDWWTQELEKGKAFGDFRQPFQMETEGIVRKRLASKVKTYGFKKTARWLAFDFLSAITFGWIKICHSLKNFSKNATSSAVASRLALCPASFQTICLGSFAAA